jgi:hypothetical protein
MADWRQIQARIRKARTGPDAPAKLTALYERTRDAMVAFELAKAHEQSGDTATALEWYQASADRFRRSDWRARAEEAITRLGGTPAPREEAEMRAFPAAAPAARAEEASAAREPAGEDSAETEAPAEEVGAVEAAPASDAQTAGSRKRTRRGRRGGRRRRKGGPTHAAPPAPTAQAKPSQQPSPPASEARPPREQPRRRGGREERGQVTSPPAEWGPIRLPDRVEPEMEESQELVQRVPQRSRAGDPGLTSRQAKLESMLRRLLASTPYNLDQAETAPAGPGVFLLSDSELTTYYYVEPCATLRIAVKMALHGRGSRSDRSERSVKSRLAEHLEIGDAQATKYMKQYCVVRWLQIDEGASHLAHYAIAVLQPALNE